MTYKAFEDFYKEAEIKHLVLHQHGDYLISPPFGTEKCKDYNKFFYYKDGRFEFLDLELPPAVSKFNGICSIGDSIWTIPYGIFDQFEIILQIKDKKPIYHKINRPGKGQFYSLANNDHEAFSFPLGYEDTAFAIHIKNDAIELQNFSTNGHKKMHMGTVYCNGKFWSPPRGDTLGYCDIVSFDGTTVKTYPVQFDQPHILRKYTDFIVKGNKLYSLPFGQNGHLNQLLIFDTETETYKLEILNLPVFFKKYNCGVLIDNVIIGVPYGDKSQDSGKYGIVYDCDTGEHNSFVIDEGLGFGGKYRFRCGLEFNKCAVFIPTGTPAAPILVIDKQSNITNKIFLKEYVLGRPVKFQEKIWIIGYHIETKKQFLITLDRSFSTEFIPIC